MNFNRKFWTEGWGSLLLAVLLALSIRWIFLEAYVIPSTSMVPTLLVHDHIFVNKLAYGVRLPLTEKWLLRNSDPQRGEVIVFKYPENKKAYFIKRVVGIPGDKIFYENGGLYINDRPVERRVPKELKSDIQWVHDKDFPEEGLNSFVHWEEAVGDHKFSILLRKGRVPATFGPFEVPKDHYFVLGDNRDNSKDSRIWGFVPRENLMGRATFIWLSCNETFELASFLCNPLTLRWGRFFKGIN